MILETAITISVNGENRIAKLGVSVFDLLRELGLDGGRVAVERNLEILPRPQWAETLVSLGTLLKNTDRATEAETTWKRAVELGRELSAAMPEEAACGTCLASALQELAAQMSETGRLAEAKPLLREALALYEKHLTRSRDVGDRVKLARSHWSLVGLPCMGPACSTMVCCCT